MLYGSGGAALLEVESGTPDNGLVLTARVGQAELGGAAAHKAKEAAEVMKLTAKDLYKLGIVEKVFDEPQDFKAENLIQVTESMESEIVRFLAEYMTKSHQELSSHRYMRFRRM